MRQNAAVAIGYAPRRPQLNHLSGNHAFERFARCIAGLGARAGFARNRRQRNLDSGQPHFAAIVEQETAAIDDGTDLPGPDRFQPAGIARQRTPLPIPVRGRRKGNQDRDTNQQSDPA